MRVYAHSFYKIFRRENKRMTGQNKILNCADDNNNSNSSDNNNKNNTITITVVLGHLRVLWNTNSQNDNN